METGRLIRTDGGIQKKTFSGRVLPDSYHIEHSAGSPRDASSWMYPVHSDRASKDQPERIDKLPKSRCGLSKGYSNLLLPKGVLTKY